MGENQGMVWIILGVLVIAAAVFILGNQIADSTGQSGDAVKEYTSSALKPANP